MIDLLLQVQLKCALEKIISICGGRGAFHYQTKGSLFVMGKDRGQKERMRAKDEQRARMKAVAVTGDSSAEAESGQAPP